VGTASPVAGPELNHNTDVQVCGDYLEAWTPNATPSGLPNALDGLTFEEIDRFQLFDLGDADFCVAFGSFRTLSAE